LRRNNIPVKWGDLVSARAGGDIMGKRQVLKRLMLFSTPINRQAEF